MREILRKLIIDTVGGISKMSHGVYILNGHYLSRSANKEPEVFIRLLSEMKNHAKFINIQDACSLVQSKEAENIDETLIAFTFDDGFDDCYHSLAPALSEYDVNACFFINPGFVEGDENYRVKFTEQVVKTSTKTPMSWTQIKALHNEGFVIGNHTFDHVRLSSVSVTEAIKQVIEAKMRIEKELNAPCDHFAWPYGQYTDVTESVIEELVAHHRYIYSGCDYRNYTSFNGNVLNRRHFEADWSIRELKYFLSKTRRFPA